MKNFKNTSLVFIKIIAFIVATFLIQRIALIPLSIISKTYWSQYDGRGLNEPWFVSSGLVLFLAALVICFVFLKYIEKKPFSYLRVSSFNQKNSPMLASGSEKE